VEQLSGLDAAFVYFEAAGAAHVTFFAIYDPTTAPTGAVGFDGVAAHLGSRLSADHLFRSVLARVPLDLDHPYWVQDTNFDLSRHLHHLTLPSPGGWRQLCEQVSQLHAKRMDLRRPPWECYFIDGLREIQDVPEGAFVVCFKMHHSAVDGVTGLGILGGLHDLTADTAPAPIDNWTPEPRPSSLNLLARTAVTYARRPARLVSAARDTIPALARLPHEMTRLLPVGHRVEDGLFGGVPHTRFNDRTDSRRNFDARAYDLAEVSAARQLVPGATVNDVILTGIGGALRRYLLDKDELPESSLVTVIAISEHIESQRGANQLAVARATLGTDIADPAARLGAVHESTAKSKAFIEGVGPRSFVEEAELLPGAVIVPTIRLARAANFGKYFRSDWFANTYVTTMRGPEFPIYLIGARMIGGYGLPPFTQGNAVMHSVLSYCGRVLVSITGCPAVLPDIEHYGDCMDIAFAELTSRATTLA
jgi:diacylglycerol O-acyltransferase / wax synthase